MKKLPKRTPWFNAMKRPPVRVGWYELDLGYAYPALYYYDGIDWVNPFTKAPMFLYPGDKWRGLIAPAE